nr:MAG TPA: hypothetical protein [Caudoviricetes sp.]
MRRRDTSSEAGRAEGKITSCQSIEQGGTPFKNIRNKFVIRSSRKKHLIFSIKIFVRNSYIVGIIFDYFDKKYSSKIPYTKYKKLAFNILKT